MKRGSAIAIVCVIILLCATAAFAVNTSLDGALFDPFTLQDRIQQHSEDQSNTPKDSSSSNKRGERQKSTNASAKEKPTTDDETSSQDSAAEQSEEQPAGDQTIVQPTTQSAEQPAEQSAQRSSTHQQSTNQATNGGSLAPAFQDDPTPTPDPNPTPAVRTFSITYNLGKGTTRTTLPSTCTEGQTLTLTNNLTRAGYTFTGWTLASNRAASPSKNMTISSANSNMAFTAHWTPVRYNITYNLNGGKIDDKQAPTTYTVESAVSIPAPTRARYAFDGWDDGSGKLTSQLTIAKGSTGNKTYTAKWRGSSYTHNTPKWHTQAEINTWLQQNPFSVNMQNEVAEEPDYSEGNNVPGKLSEDNQQNALRATNLIRYLAGLDPFRLDAANRDNAQRAAVLLAHMNTINHYPGKPADVSKAFYDGAYWGCNCCNLVAGHGPLASSVINSFVPDPGNLGTSLGHRSWILNPPKKFTVFGYYKDPSNGAGARTMWATGGTGVGLNGTPNPDYVAWPAGDMPVDCFPKVNAEMWWSVSHLRNLGRDDGNIKITVTELNSGEEIVITPQDKFNGRNKMGKSLTLNGMIIFNPGKEFKAGDRVKVHIDGIYSTKDGLASPIEYTVNFTDNVLDKVSYRAS